MVDFTAAGTVRAGGGTGGRGNDLSRWSTNGTDIILLVRLRKSENFRQINLQKF